eukprot:XP_011665821.1 PREDICTED: protein Skeletor, isoforms B/C [Strongylocentrotus purpuratus]
MPVTCSLRAEASKSTPVRLRCRRRRLTTDIAATPPSAVIRSYSGATVTVTLIDNITIADIGHIGLWCVRFRQDFGHVDIPDFNVLNIPPLPLATLTTTAPITTTTVSTTTAGTTTAGTTTAVFSGRLQANFGHVIFPAAFVPPSPYNLGALGFSPLVHRTSAAAVVVLDPKKIRFEDLNYDGFGPDAYFWVGPGDTPSYDEDYRIPDETGSLQVIRSYSGATVTVTLIDNITIADIGHIGLWCVRFRQDFGHVDIPDFNVLNIPPLPLATLTTTAPITTTTVSTTTAGTTTAGTTTAGTTPSMGFCNCETLVVGELQVCWFIDGTDIVIRHSTPNEVETYTAFGVSGSPTSTQMVGGDVVVTFVDGNGVAQAVDYYLGSQAQCSPQNGAGACPDVISSNSASNDVTLVESSIDNGMTHIVYRRPLAASDATYDKAISTTEPTYVIWARGLINADGRVAYHSQRSPGTSNLQINFNRVSSTCAPGSDTTTAPSNPSDTTPSEEEGGWTIEGIVETENATFTVEMGLTGGQQGYNYITGSVGWGIAWFINGELIPELTLRRGKTYTFLVSGGDVPSMSANYHPFYITDDPSGGYAQLPQDEQQAITIYAGPEEGPLCQWTSTSDTGSPDLYTSFEDYKNKLTVVCQPGEPGELVWTVPMDAPDLLYYHCYTHRFLGWKIHLVDGDENMTSQKATTNDGSTTTADDGSTTATIVGSTTTMDDGSTGGGGPSIATSPISVAAASIFAALALFL